LLDTVENSYLFFIEIRGSNIWIKSNHEDVRKLRIPGYKLKSLSQGIATYVPESVPDAR
jgi:hypothetical protein